MAGKNSFQNVKLNRLKIRKFLRQICDLIWGFQPDPVPGFCIHLLIALQSIAVIFAAIIQRIRIIVLYIIISVYDKQCLEIIIILTELNS